MNEKSRRNILKGLAVGTPMVWAKPVVESVMLPAHAESTINPAPPPTPCDFSGCFAETDIAQVVIHSTPMDLLAQQPPPNWQPKN
jgi:hypothetical protein